MIGIDIAHLPDEPNHARQTRYAGKIFRKGEEELMPLSDPGLRIALAWTVKESAYKCCSRQTLTPFIPTDYYIERVVSVAGSDNGGLDCQGRISGLGFGKLTHFLISVNTPVGVLTTKSILGKRFVFTIAVGAPGEIERAYWSIEEIQQTGYPEQSRQVKENMINDLQRRQHILPNVAYAFSPAGAIPELYIEGKKHALQLSFSHDRQFIAYAYIRP